MAGQAGRLLLLKLGTVASPGATIGGQRATSVRINNRPIELTNKDSNRMVELLDGEGIGQYTIPLSGAFLDDAAMATIEGYAEAKSLNAMHVVHPNGDTWEGTWMITDFNYDGPYEGEQQYSFTLVSSGSVTRTQA